jgi:PAS domain S-box-containing protein
VKQRHTQALDRVLLRILLLYLILPSLILILLATVLISYRMLRDLETQQLQIVSSLTHTVDDYLEHAGRVLGTAARVAETSSQEQLNTYIQAIWQKYGYFDALYWLDPDGIVALLAPPDPSYQGLDMSRQPYFMQVQNQTDVVISPPFNSPQTGQPTVYMAYSLPDNSVIVGALNLGAIQEAITAIVDEPGHDTIFIADQFGALLAHPQPEMVAQQANIGHLNIVQRGLSGATTSLYMDNGKLVFGSAAPTQQAKWIIVAQMSLSEAYRPYIRALGPVLLLVPVIWLVMIWGLQRQITHQVVTPLAQLSQEVNVLSDGDFTESEVLSTIPTAFAEVDTLATNFKRMSQAIQARQAALMESETRFREMAELLPDMIFEMDAELNIIYANRAALEAFGYTKAELDRGIPASQLLHEDEIERVQKGLPITVRRERVPLGIYRVKRKNGEIFLCEVKSALIRDDAGNFVGLRGVMRDVTKRKRAEEEIQQRTAQLEALRQVGLELTIQLDPDALLRSIVTRAVELLRGAIGAFDLYRPDQDVLEFSVYTGISSTPGKTIFQRGEGLVGKVWETGQPLIVNDYQCWEGRVDFWDEHLHHSAIVGVPVHWGDEFLGVLEVMANPPRTFALADAELLSLFATQAAIAIRNARLHEETRRRAEELAVLNELGQALTARLSVEAVLNEAHRGASRLMDTTNFYIGLYDPVKDEIAFRFDVSESGQDAHITTLPADQGLAGYIVQNHTAVLIREHLAEQMTKMGIEQIGEIALSWLGVPLTIGDRVLGVMAVQSYTTPRAYDEHDRNLLTAIASQTAIALENAHLYEGARRSALEQRTLREAALALMTTLDRNEVIERILAQLQEVVPYDTASVQLRRGQLLEIVGGHGFPNLPDLLGITFLVGGDNPNSEVIRTRASFIVKDAPAVYEEFLHEPHAQAGIRSWLGVPMLVGDQLIGMIALDKAEPGFYTEEHAQLALTFAAQAAVAIENTQLYEQAQHLLNQQIAVNRLALALGEYGDLDKVYHTIYEHVQTLMATDAFIVSSYDDETKLIHAEYVVTQGAVHDAKRFPPIPLETKGQGTQSQVIHAGKSFYVPDWRKAMAKTTTEYKIAENGQVSQGPPPSEQQKDSTNSALLVPMKIEGKTIGVMQVQSHRLNAYTQEDIDLLTALANVAAIAIQNTRLYGEARSRAAHLSALNAVIAAAAATTSLLNLLEIALGHTLTALRLEIGAIWLAGQNITRGLPPEASQLGVQMAQAVWGDAPNSIIVEDWEQVTEGKLSTTRPLLIRFGIHSSITVPILTAAGYIGGLSIASAIPQPWSAEEIALVEAVGRQLGTATERLRLFQSEQEQRELAEALEKAAAAVSSTLDLDQVLNRILEQVERIVPGDAFNIMLLEKDTIRIVRWRGYGPLGVEAGIRHLTMSTDTYPRLAELVRTGKTDIVSDTSVHPDWTQIEGWEWLRSCMASPIRIGNETVGFLNVDSTLPDRFSPADAQRLQALTSHAATAIENARLFKEAQQRVAELEALQRTSLQLTSSLDLTAVLDTVAESALNLVGASDCHIYLYDEETQTFTFGTALWDNGRHEAAVLAPRPDGLTAIVAQGGCPVVINDALDHPLYTTPEAREWGVHAIAGFPLKQADRVLGIFTIAFLKPHTFTSEEVRVLNLLVNQAAIAIENAQLYQRLRGHANQLEQRVQERTAQIQAQYARQEAILYSASDGIIVADAAGEIVQTNPVAQAWLTQTLSPEDAARLQRAVRELVQQTNRQVTTTGTSDVERPETSLELAGLDLELKAAPISAPGVEDAAAVVAVHDVSHLKALNHMKSRFVTNISHELRTPVTTIKLYATLMQKVSPQDERWSKYLEALAQEADRQARLVEDILQISRIDAGRLEMSPQPTALNELVHIAIDSRQIMAESHGLTLEHHPAEPGPTTLVDPERMAQVLDNLLSNAIRYTPAGGEIIVSTGTEKTKGRTWATATVADTGIGIPSGELPYIFDRFFRGMEPRSMQVPGTGLGLTIVKEIVELHGGWVTVKSTVGVGATFTVWLPLAD